MRRAAGTLVEKAPLVSTRLYARRVPVAPLVDDDLIQRSLRVRARDVVYVKGIFEASEGLGGLFAEHGGDLLVITHPSREHELDELLADLASEIGAIIEA